MPLFPPCPEEAFRVRSDLFLQIKTVKDKQEKQEKDKKTSTDNQVTNEVAKSTVRFSFDLNNTKEEIDSVVEVLKTSLTKLKKVSPVKVPKK